MFDLQQALGVLNGETLSFEDLRARLQLIRINHLDEVAPELSVNEMISLARKHSWVQEDEAGRLFIHA